MQSEDCSGLCWGRVALLDSLGIPCMFRGKARRLRDLLLVAAGRLDSLGIPGMFRGEARRLQKSQLVATGV